MSILKLAPSCKDYLWGGHRLKDDYHKNYNGEILAETWELSCHPDGPSTIVNGDWAGLTLKEYLEKAGIPALGDNCRKFDEFPILIKFIDAKDNLSVQVHPDNTYALENEGQYGKTEMWYVMDAAEGASLFYGFAKEVSEEEFEERIRNHTLTDVLNKVMIHKGDVLFIDPGTIHAIGAGSLIAEIQQNSNVTYRVYDYGRKGPDGKERELHVDKALQVTKREPAATDRDFGPHVASCEYFTVDKVILDGLRRKKLTGEADGTSFVSVLVMSGAGKITASGQTMEVKKGDSIFITAGSGEYELEGDMEALITTV